MENNRRKFLVDSAKLVAAGLLLPDVVSAKGRLADETILSTIQNKVPKKHAKILLRSAWAITNIGDIGHTPGTLQILEKYMPGAEVTLWAYNVTEEIESMLTRRFPRVKIIKGTLAGKEDEPLNSEIMAAFEATDFFLYNSGMHFNHGLFDYDWNRLMVMMTQFYICQALGKPYGLYGHSFDKFAPPSPYVFAPILNKASFIYCRDSESLKFLKKNNIKAPIMEFAPDGCFGIDVLDEEKAIRFLKENGLEDGKFIALITRSNTPKTGVEITAVNKLNPPVATAQQREWDRIRFEKINALVTAWVRKTKMKVLLVPEVSKEIPHSKTLVYDQQPEDVKPYLVHRTTFWNADEAVSVYKRAHIVVGMEPHSLIMAMAVGISVIHLCPFQFGRKGWMFKDIGLPEWLFDIDKDDKRNMISALFTIHDNYEDSLRKVTKAMAYVHERQRVTMVTLAKAIDS